MLPEQQEMEEIVSVVLPQFQVPQGTRNRGTGEQGPKGKEVEENRNFSKKNATKLLVAEVGYIFLKGMSAFFLFLCFSVNLNVFSFSTTRRI